MSPRQLADQCCRHCKEQLDGEGPWCARCGVEMPGAPTDDGDFGHFANDLCNKCAANVEEYGS